MQLSQTKKSTTGMAATALSFFLSKGVEGRAMSASNTTQALTGFPPCDALIAANLSHAVHLPSSPRYTDLVNDYWALSTRKAPWCFVLPSSIEEVSQTLKTLNAAGGGAGDWHIAIRSGGHGSGNSNNIEEGVTIDLSQLNSTTYNAATNIASVGTGARWKDVYTTLNDQGVSVTGGREGVVGVGGFLLGGGNSWFTARTGFACDSVINYQVVTSSGVVIDANATVHADLWRALKGGGSNFGLVTRFDIEAFPSTNMLIEQRTYAEEHSSNFVDAVAGFTDLDRSFQDNGMIALTTWNAENGTMFSSVEVNTMNNPNTTAWDAFKRIPTVSPPTRQSVTQAQAAQSEQVAGAGLNAGSILTIGNDPQVMRHCLEQHNNLISDLSGTIGAENFTTTLNFQPLPSYFADIGVEKGGNSLGLERNSCNKIIFIATVALRSANSEQQYPAVYQKVVAMGERIDAFAKSVGRGQEFLYLNYADANQDPLGSYGAASVEHLRQVANKYDPRGFFQRRVPGGFKISRVN